MKAKNSHIVIAIEKGVYHTAPTKFSTLSELQIIRHIYEPLFNYSPASEILPGVLTQWEVKAKGEKWKFKVRQNSFFHNGAPINADSVIWNLKEHILWSTGLIKHFKALRKVDDYTILLELTSPVASLLHRFAGPQAFVIAPAAGLTRNVKKAVGSGIFKQTRSSSADTYLLKRVAEESKKKNLVQFVEFKQFNNGEEMWNALNCGEADVIYECPYEFISCTDFPPGFTRKYCDSFSVNMLFLNIASTIIKNSSVRQLIAGSIDQRKLIDETTGGVGIASTGPISPASSFYMPPGKEYYHRKSSLHDLQTHADTELTILAQSCYNHYFVTELCRQIEQSGIGCKIEKMPMHSLIDRVKSGGYEAALLGTGGMQDPEFMLYDFFHSAGRHNISHFCNETYDELLSKARCELDFQKRKELYNQAVDILHHEVPAVFLRHGVSLVMYPNTITCIDPYPDNLLRLEQAQINL